MGLTYSLQLLLDAFRVPSKVSIALTSTRPDQGCSLKKEVGGGRLKQDLDKDF